LTYERSLIDLAALRFYPPILPGMAAPRRRFALVHDGLRAGQPDRELPGVAVRARARGGDAPRPRSRPGHPSRPVSGRGAGQDSARAAPRRADGVRAAAALAVLRGGRLDAALPRRPRRAGALDG
jgi:hypothetical protein